MQSYHYENAKYASLGTSKTSKAPQNFTENSPYLSLGTSKTLKDAWPSRDVNLPRAEDEVSMETQTEANIRRRRRRREEGGGRRESVENENPIVGPMFLLF
jgi:hypothetical protein